MLRNRRFNNLVATLFGPYRYRGLYLYHSNEQRHKMINDMTQAELEVAILSDKSLYAEYNEDRLMNGGYTLEQMKEIAQAWVEAGDECSN